MGTAEIKISIEQHFVDNWVNTPVQFEGVEFEYSGLDSWVSLIYNPVANMRYGLDGTIPGRLQYKISFKVFCYGKSATKAFQLADTLKTFLNGKILSNSRFGIGQDGTAIDLDNGYFEVPVIFEIDNFS